MCNDYEQHIRWDQYCAMMQAAVLGMPTQQSHADLPQADDIKINDMGPVSRRGSDVRAEVEREPRSGGSRRSVHRASAGRFARRNSSSKSASPALAANGPVYLASTVLVRGTRGRSQTLAAKPP